MRAATLRELASLSGVRLGELFPETERRWWSALPERGWGNFQDRYDVARSTIRSSSDIRRVIFEAAEDNARDGAVWVEMQVDPTSYAEMLGGMRAAVEVFLGAVRSAGKHAGLGMALIVAGSWARSPKEAEELAALAGEYARDGVVAFGLSNDERVNAPRAFARAAATARDAGLAFVPHSGFFGSEAIE